MIRLVFSAVALLTAITLFSAGFEAAILVGGVLGIAGLLFCLPWIAMGDRA